MTSGAALIVHWGDLAPTKLLVSHVVAEGIRCVVVANDGAVRPDDIDDVAVWLVPPRNLGYFGAVAWACEAESLLGRSEVVAVLNTDISLGSGQLAQLLDHVGRHPSVGIAAPNLRFPDGSLQSGAARLTPLRKAPDVMVEPVGTTECTWVTGAVMAIRGSVISSVGLDATYFLGAEDLDLCVRAGREGWKVHCLGDLRVEHQRSAVITGPRWYYYSTRNLIWCSRELFGAPVGLLNSIIAATLLLRVLAADILKDRGLKASQLMAMGILDGLRRKPPRSSEPPLAEPRPQRVIAW